MQARLAWMLGLYGALAGLALLWARIAAIPSLLEPAPGRMGVLAAAGSGLALGLASVAVAAALTRWWPHYRRLAQRMASLLGPLDGRTILLASLASAVAEELLFRGALLPSLGLWGSSLVFGLAHIPPERRFWLWTVSAFGMGLALGALVQLTGSLLPAILAHFTINYFDFHLLERLGRSAPATGEWS